MLSAFVCNLSSPTSQDLPRFQELIFEDFSQFILVENVFEEVVLQSVTKEWWTCMETLAWHRLDNWRVLLGPYSQSISEY
jgi:hypothetical protein